MDGGAPGPIVIRDRRRRRSSNTEDLKVDTSYGEVRRAPEALPRDVRSSGKIRAAIRPISTQPPKRLARARSRRRILIALLALSLGGSLFPAAAFASDGTMTGEAIGGPLVVTSAHCDPDGTSSITFEASGVAVGPYNGTYTETGTVVMGPTDNPLTTRPIVTDFQADFRIETVDGTVITGHKSFNPNVAQFNGRCHEGPYPNGDTASYAWLGNVRYTAVIETASEIRHESGSVSVIGSVDRLRYTNADGSVVFIEQTNLYESFGTGHTDSAFPKGPGAPALVALSPAAAVNPVGTNHTVVASVTDASQRATPGIVMRFTTAGSTNISGSCTTDAAGQCGFTYTGPVLPGADVITACADTNNNGSVDPGEPCGEATKAWILPASTPGQVTGGGYILDPGDNEKVAFGFNAQSTTNGIKGNCTVVDAAPLRNVKIKCLTVTTLVQTATHATFFGQAEINGVLTDYRIDVDDTAEPGKGVDLFKIVTGSGYVASGILDGGNIQVHRAD